MLASALLPTVIAGIYGKHREVVCVRCAVFLVNKCKANVLVGVERELDVEMAGDGRLVIDAVTKRRTVL